MIKSWHRILAAGSVIGALSLVAACSTTTPQSGSGASTSGSASNSADSPAASKSGCIKHFDSGKDYFPHKEKLSHASNFTIKYHKSYQVITVKQPQVGGKPEHYVLVKCGAPKPKLSGKLAKAQQVTTPVHSLFSASTTHLPDLEALGKLDTLTGVASKSLISSKAARDRASSSKVTQFAKGGKADAEKIVSAKPDALITGGTPDKAYSTVKKAGIPVLADADFLESDPLGKAEWIKFFGALTGTEQKATKTFDKIAHRYHKAVDKVSDVKPVSAVLGQPYEGKWGMDPGGSYFGHMITDAGGTWAWQHDKSTATKNVSLSTVLKRSRSAKVWITASNWTTKKDVKKADSRLTKFKAYKSGQVWAPSKQVNSSGGNNYYEEGALRPDLAVKDLIAILHPDSEPGHTMVFYQKLD
jgi:iron complex transport system substrate-binding protein